MHTQHSDSNATCAPSLAVNHPTSTNLCPSAKVLVEPLFMPDLLPQQADTFISTSSAHKIQCLLLCHLQRLLLLLRQLLPVSARSQLAHLRQACSQAKRGGRLLKVLQQLRIPELLLLPAPHHHSLHIQGSHEAAQLTSPCMLVHRVSAARLRPVAAAVLHTITTSTSKAGMLPKN